MARIWSGSDSRSKPTSTTLPHQRCDTPGSFSSMKHDVQPACDQGRPRICAPAADGGHDEDVGAPHGERGSSAYMAISPVFRYRRHSSSPTPNPSSQMMMFGAGMVLLAFNTMDERRLGLLDYLNGSPTKLLPVLDIASSSPFRQCFKLMSCRVMPTSSEYHPSVDLAGISLFCQPHRNQVCQCLSQDLSFQVLEQY